MAVDHASIGDEVGKVLRFIDVIQKIIDGGASVTIDSIDQLRTEAEDIFDDDATARQMLGAVNGFLNKWHNSMVMIKRSAYDLVYDVLRNRIRGEVGSTALSGDPAGLIGDWARRMRDDSMVVKSTTVTAGTVVARSGNTGNGTFILDMLNAWNENNNGIQNQDFIGECIADSYTGGTNPHQEMFRVSGSFGHTLSGIVNCIYPGSDGSGYDGGGNRLQNEAGTTPGGNNNSDTDIPFENFTSDTPDGWTVDTGTPGTDVLKETGASNVYIGSASLKLVGDGATLLEISQDANDFYDATSTDQKLEPGAHYAIGMRVKSDVGALDAGVISLYMDGTGYTAGSSEKATADLPTDQPTSFTLFKGTVQMPMSVPSDMKIVLKTTTALTATKVAYIDTVFLAKLWHSPQFGLNIHFVGGSEKAVSPPDKTDQWYWSSTNAWGSDALFQRLASRVSDPNDVMGVPYYDQQVPLPHDATESTEYANSKAT